MEPLALTRPHRQTTTSQRQYDEIKAVASSSFYPYTFERKPAAEVKLHHPHAFQCLNDMKPIHVLYRTLCTREVLHEQAHESGIIANSK
jgi:hypothetical protein